MGVIMYNGVQYTGAGGGSGDVEDVYVNGTSVLDSNKIAQVKSYMELTESQYNALPASKLSDDILYCISDIDYEDRNYFNPIIYSIEEREVGVWVDNKPLYQKTTYFGEISTNANYGLTMDIGVNIVDTVIDMFANAKVSSGAWVVLPYPLPSANYAAYLDGYNKSTDKLTIKTGNARSFVEGYATIYYTKSTDTAGSGSYNTLGVPKVHYSTDEQVIGTWIDGKPLYQKTYSINETIYNQDKTIDVSSLNIDKYVSGEGTFMRNVYRASPVLYIDTPFNLYESSFNHSYLRYGRTSKTIDYGVFLGNNEAATDITFTIKYTKTTD